MEKIYPSFDIKMRHFYIKKQQLQNKNWELRRQQTREQARDNPWKRDPLLRKQDFRDAAAGVAYATWDCMIQRLLDVDDGHKR